VGNKRRNKRKGFLIMMLDGMTLEEAEALLEASKRRSSNENFLYIKLTDLYNTEITYHIVRKDKLHIWLTGLSTTKETAYIYEAIENNDGELVSGEFIQQVELNKGYEV
jgi:hypothetical protein